MSEKFIELLKIKKEVMAQYGFGEGFYDEDFESEGLLESSLNLQEAVALFLTNSLTKKQLMANFEIHFSVIAKEVEADFWQRVETAKTAELLKELSKKNNRRFIELRLGNNNKLPTKEQKFLVEKFLNWEYHDSDTESPLRFIIEDIFATGQIV